MNITELTTDEKDRRRFRVECIGGAKAIDAVREIVGDSESLRLRALLIYPACWEVSAKREESK